MKAARLRLGAFKLQVEAAVVRVQDYTRMRFDLPPEAAVMVTELECSRPGCPPLETVVAFWDVGDQRRHFRVFKPVGAVMLSDLPPAWLKDALCAEPDDEFACC